MAYHVLFGGEPPAYAANAYDALCLLAYGLERSGGEGGEKLAQALAEVVDARGAATGWDREGIAAALAAIRAGNLPDLRGAASPFLTAGDLMAILSGQRSARLPTVVESTAGDDVYVFWVGHGGSMGALVNASSSDPSKEASATFLDPFMLQDTLQTMFVAQRYRRLLMVVEACEAGVLGAKLDATGAVLLTGANPTESSFGANYDPSLGAWLADGFAYEYFLRATSASDITLDALYSELYFAVPGSHVSVYNSHGFGPMANVSLGEFIK